MQDLSTREKEIVLFDSLPELVQKARYYLSHPEERECIALAGRQRAMRDHTWKQRFQTLFASLDIVRPIAEN